MRMFVVVLSPVLSPLITKVLLCEGCTEATLAEKSSRISGAGMDVPSRSAKERAGVASRESAGGCSGARQRFSQVR